MKTIENPPDPTDRTNQAGVAVIEKSKPGWLHSAIVVVALAVIGVVLAVWKINAIQQAASAASNQPEPAESVTVKTAVQAHYQPTSTSIGTVVALRSITLQNEIPGTVSRVALEPGRIVEEGALLVALDVSVEEAELKAQEAQAALAETLLSRMEQAVQGKSMSQMELDKARSELDVAKAQIARIQAIIARKTIRAPFRARIGISDIHPGQYLNAGSRLTTLQGVDETAYVDFTVPQNISQWLDEGVQVHILTHDHSPPVEGEILALDARVDPVTRSTTVRARVKDSSLLPSPGASVRVRVPSGEAVSAVAIPISALRKGPSGDHVFKIVQDPEGRFRAQSTRIRIGAAMGDDLLVLDGISAGDRVAAAGSFKLRDRALVQIIDPDESEPNVANAPANP